MRRAIAMVTILTLIASSPFVFAQEDSETGVRKTLESFLLALSSGDQESFENHFSPDATVFSPFPWSSERTDVTTSFGPLFERLSKRSSTGATNGLNPLDLAISIHGDVAIATFHLQRRSKLNRRTLVLVRAGETWKVVHLHASSENSEQT